MKLCETQKKTNYSPCPLLPKFKKRVSSCHDASNRAIGAVFCILPYDSFKKVTYKSLCCKAESLNFPIHKK